MTVHISLSIYAHKNKREKSHKTNVPFPAQSARAKSLSAGPPLILFVGTSVLQVSGSSVRRFDSTLVRQFASFPGRHRVVTQSLPLDTGLLLKRRRLTQVQPWTL